LIENLFKLSLTNNLRI